VGVCDKCVQQLSISVHLLRYKGSKVPLGYFYCSMWICEYRSHKELNLCAYIKVDTLLFMKYYGSFIMRDYAKDRRSYSEFECRQYDEGHHDDKGK
jgi:outer membrane protein assembly factor BamD (BamD/ComL family)